MRSAFTPGAVVNVSIKEPLFTRVLVRERSVSRFARGDEAVPFGLADLCLAAAAETAWENQRGPCAGAARALSS